MLLTDGGVPPTRAQSSGKKSVHAFLATSKVRKRSTNFSADVAAIYVFWKGDGLAAGDIIRAIWIAEDVGGATQKDTEIRRADSRVFESNAEGAFSLTRPKDKTWPIGNYRVELYVNSGIAELVKFKIEPAATIEVH